MNPYNFSVLFFASCTFTLSLLILLKRRDEIAKFYFIFSCSVAIWASLWALMVSENISYEMALTYSRLSHCVGGLVGILWFHFCSKVSQEYPRYKKLLNIFYLIAFFSILFFFTPYFVPEVVSVIGFKHYTKTGPVLDFYMAVFVISVGLGFMTLNRKIQVSIGEEKKQVHGLFIATLIGFIGGFCTILPIYGINIPPYTVFIIPVYPFVMFYFMMKHRLFDLEVVAQSFQREKLATIGLLASSINHEIRNPLYAAKGLLDNYVELTKEGLKQKDPMEVAEKTRTQIERALDVITKLNRFAKPANNEPSPTSHAFIQEAIQNVLDLVSYEFELDKIKIINQIDPELPSIQADQRQLEEILFNLIVNACHALKGKEGGELVIASEMFPCHSRASGNPQVIDPRLKHSGMTDKVRIIIQDTGSGIPSEQAKHLFEPFHTTKGENGTGLGLYITKQLVERNGGKIAVKSQEDKGTSFILEFKIA